MKKKVILLIILLFIIIIIFKRANNKNVKYKIKADNYTYNIVEKYNSKYYYFEISNKNNTYPINIYGLKKSKKQITGIYDFKSDKLNCILPVFNDSILTDMMCYKEDILYNYQTIKGENVELDKYVRSIKEYNLNTTDNREDRFNEIITFYQEIDKNVSITTYKGLIIDNKEVKLFNKDVYSNKISTYLNNYYITADYNSSYEFDKFYVVDLESSEVSTIKAKNPISFDSYIQGIVDNKVYLYDPENEVQYEIDPKNKNIKVTSGEYMKYYSNNTWGKISVKATKKELLFDYSTLNNKYSDYDKVYENDYYYYLVKDKNLYRINKNKQDIKNYILEIPVEEISISDNYLYYVDKDSLYYYSDITGLKLVLMNKELEFNKYIKYYIY